MLQAEQAMAEFATMVEIDATPETVFDYLVTSEGMTAWMGQRAVLDPTSGGEFSVDISGFAVRGSYVEVDRPRRVVVTWGIAGSDDFPPGLSTVSFTLSATAHGTRLELLHSDIPQSRAAGHSVGWDHFLPRLQRAARGEDLGADLWSPA
jgi:uncharacterized protein YndB with AHSA1/START domain